MKVAVLSIACVLVAALYGLPHVFHETRSPVPAWASFTGPPDQEFYLTLVEESYRGRSDFISPFWGGHDDVQGSPLPAFPIRMLGNFQRILRLTPKTLTTICDTLLPTLFFLLMFGMGRRIGLGFRTSLLASAMATATPFMLYGEPAFLYRVLNVHRVDNYDYFLPLSRFVNPQAGAVFFAGALYFIASKRDDIKSTVAGAALTLLCSASNFYMGSALMAYGGIELALGLATRRRRVEIASAAGCLFAAALPFALKAVEVSRLGEIFPDMYSLDMAYSRLPLITKGEALALVLLAAHIAIRRRDFFSTAIDRFMTLSSLAYVAALNQQIITGRIVSAWHYEYYVFNFILPFNAAIVAIEMLKKKFGESTEKLFAKPVAWAVAAALMAVFFADGAIEQAHGYRAMAPVMARIESECKAPFDWMNSNLAAPNVFLAWPYPTAEYQADVAGFIPIYTRQKVLLSSSSTFYPLTGMAEARKRHMIVFSLMGMDDASFQLNVVADNGIFHSMFFHKNVYENRAISNMLFDPRRVPPLTSEEIAAAIRDFDLFENIQAEKLMEIGKVDYVYWGPAERRYFAKLKPDQSAFMEKSFSDGNVSIYKVVLP